jgi:hypothetical protein
MAAYGIVELLAVAADNIDASVKTFISGDDIENGSVFTLGAAVSGQEDEFAAVKPASGTLATQHYMAASPTRVVTAINGNNFYDLIKDPRAFINVAGEPIDGVMLKIGDVVRLSTDAVSGSYVGSGSVTTHVVATNAAYKLAWATGAISGLSLKYLRTTYISVPNTFGSQRLVAYDFIVDAVA